MCGCTFLCCTGTPRIRQCARGVPLPTWPPRHWRECRRDAHLHTQGEGAFIKHNTHGSKLWLDFLATGLSMSADVILTFTPKVSMGLHIRGVMCINNEKTDRMQCERWYASKLSARFNDQDVRHLLVPIYLNNLGACACVCVCVSVCVCGFVSVYASVCVCLRECRYLYVRARWQCLVSRIHFCQVSSELFCCSLKHSLVAPVAN